MCAPRSRERDSHTCRRCARPARGERSHLRTPTPRSLPRHARRFAHRFAAHATARSTARELTAECRNPHRLPRRSPSVSRGAGLALRASCAAPYTDADRDAKGRGAGISETQNQCGTSSTSVLDQIHTPTAIAAASVHHRPTAYPSMKPRTRVTASGISARRYQPAPARNHRGEKH
jgi:hypothetical protein